MSNREVNVNTSEIHNDMILSYSRAMAAWTHYYTDEHMKSFV